MGKKAGLWINRSKLDAEILIPQLINWFNAHDWECVIDWNQQKDEHVEFIVSLGGTERFWNRPGKRLHIKSPF